MASAFQHIVVELTLHLIFGMGVDVNAKVLPTAHNHGFGVANCRIIIKIERNFVVTDSSLAYCNYGTCVRHTIVL